MAVSRDKTQMSISMRLPSMNKKSSILRTKNNVGRMNNSRNQYGGAMMAEPFGSNSDNIGPNSNNMPP